jgi:hypothetical protein
MPDDLHPCAACGFRVHRTGPGSGAVCRVCGWIDDFEQLVHPDLTYGANAGSSLRLAQARAALVRERAGLERDPDWRPLRPDEVPVADPGGPASPVCYVATPDPADFVPYWRRGRGR